MLSQVFSETEIRRMNHVFSTNLVLIQSQSKSYVAIINKFKSYITKKTMEMADGMDKDEAYALYCLDILSIISNNFNTMRVHITPNMFYTRYMTTEQFNTYQSLLPENGVVYHTNEMVFAKNVYRDNYKNIIDELGIYVPQEYSDDIYSYLSLILTDKEKEQYNFK